MPTILRKGGYRFFFYSHEADEPPHVHVEKGDAEAKLWLDPLCVADNDGFPAHELQKIYAVVEAHRQYLRQRYHETHGT